MKFTINTIRFQEMIANAVRGASTKRYTPLSDKIGIEVQDSLLKLTTTDGTNYLFIFEPDVSGEDGYVTLEIDTLSKLISKITSETVTVELEDKYLQVNTGSGNYKLEIPIENGGPVKFIDPTADDMTKIADINLIDIKTILAGVRSALATKTEIPFYMHYYVGENVVGTDTIKASAYNKQVLDGSPRLVNVNMMNLLDIMTDDAIEVYANDTQLKFVTPKVTVFGTMPAGLEDYSIESINNFLTIDFPYSCLISKVAVENALDRIKLFVSNFDEGAISLSFSNQALTISSKATNGIETIPYETELDGDINFECMIEINNFMLQVHSQLSDTVNLQFGLPNALKLVGDDITSIVGLFH